MKLTYILEKTFADMDICSGAVAEIRGVSISASSTSLEVLKAEAVHDVLALKDQNIVDNPILQSYRQLVSNIGRSNKKFPPAAENLILQIRRNKQLPTINTAVDCYNIIVAQSYLALGVHDIDKIGSTIRFRISSGGEPFRAVGSDSVKMTQPGDFVYSDDTRVLAWLDSKDSDDVKVSAGTKNIVIIIQGTAITESSYNYEVAERACRLITSYCGGTYSISSISELQ